ncbi:MAG: hypothetical protein R3325_00235 [Thermoanaerobaculia bacterium]|nr:hypothetical protein [Thermoanaerobaculia bacterium]
MKRVVGVAILVALSFGGGVHAERLDNAAIVQLHQLGFSVEVILAKIRTEPCEFDTSTEALGELLEAGVPQEVIAEMINPGRAAAAPAVPPTAAPGSIHVVTQRQAGVASRVAANFAGTPCNGLRPGIYYEGLDEPMRIRGRKASSEGGSSNAVTHLTKGIIGQKRYAYLNGVTATQQIQGRNPVFLFCFEEAEAGLAHETEGSSTPEDFILAQLEIRSKKGLRRMQTGKHNFWTGSRSGTKLKWLVQFAVEELAAGVYRVEPIGAMSPGEYAFYVSPETTKGSVYFFGVSISDTPGRFYDFGYVG